jgi:hypothetical protein
MNAPMKQYDRATQDVGNIVLLEHYNTVINDQRLATLFYVVGLGGTRDPYIFMGLENMWVNYGRTQVHLPSRGPAPKPEVLRGTAGFVVPSLAELKKRLAYVDSEIKRVVPGVQTKFSWEDKGEFVEATCPWGNRIRCHAPAPEYGKTELGFVYVDFDVPPGTADGIARFYSEVMKAPGRVEGNKAVVKIGSHQKLYFTETSKPQPDYDNHHIQVYIADFSGPYEWLKKHGLISMEMDESEWRFQWIVDPKAPEKKLFQIEHEVRSTKHRLFGRPLVNRNPAITNMTYTYGHDAFRGTY